ncbi:hypothetical protein, partial [Kitasatospora nipponensis]|uniref:hypothetical protein n=1 Tax=Kitasatospora nipponensis TaxID=258049 RepID=UPI003CD09FE7
AAAAGWLLTRRRRERVRSLALGALRAATLAPPAALSADRARPAEGEPAQVGEAAAADTPHGATALRHH